VPEPFDLRRDHRQVRLLGLPLRFARHVWDHLGQHVKQVLLEHDEVPIHRSPVACVFQRLRLRILSEYQSLDVSALPGRPSSLLSIGGHIHIVVSISR